jgi:hypothetical protein
MLKLGFILLGPDDLIAQARIMAPELGCCVDGDQDDQLLMAEAFDGATSYEAAKLRVGSLISGFRS